MAALVARWRLIAFVSVRDKQVISVASAQGDGPATQLTRCPRLAKSIANRPGMVVAGPGSSCAGQAATDTTAAGDQASGRSNSPLASKSN